SGAMGSRPACASLPRTTGSSSSRRADRFPLAVLGWPLSIDPGGPIVSCSNLRSSHRPFPPRDSWSMVGNLRVFLNDLRRRWADASLDIWRPREFTAIELHCGSRVTVDSPRHWHDEFYLSVTLGGVSHLQCRGAAFSAHAGQLVVVAPGEIHANQKAD